MNEMGHTSSIRTKRRTGRWIGAIVVVLVLAVVAAGGALVATRGVDGARDALGLAAAAPIVSARTIALPIAAATDARPDGAVTLSAVVAKKDGFVAIGADSSGGGSVPVFLMSGPDGRSWKQGAVEGGSGSELAQNPRHLAASTTGLLALGEVGERTATWASTDGEPWRRRLIDRSAFLPSDTVRALTAATDGWIAVGTSGVAGEPTRGVLWRSTDGVSWDRQSADDLGLALPAGVRGDAFNGVAVDGQTVVVVGHESNESAADHQDWGVVWRSTDGGRRLVRAPTEVELAGTGTRSFLLHVVRTGSRWYATGAGGDFVSGGYDPVVVSSPDGVSWTRAQDRAVAARGDDFIEGMTATSPGRWTSVGSNGGAPLSISGGSGSLELDISRSNRLPSTVGLLDVAALDDVLVVVGQDTARDGSASVLATAKADQPLERVELPQLARQQEPTSGIAQVIARPGGLLAVGEAGGDAAVWTSPDGATWSSTALPAPLKGQVSRSLSAVAPLGSGWTAVGSASSDRTSAGLWLRQADGRAVRSVQLGDLLVGGNDFADRDLSGVANRVGVTVAVGTTDDGGGRDSALVVRSRADGPLVGSVSATRPVSGSVAEGTALDALNGGPGTGRYSYDVAADADTYLAVGAAGTGLDRPYVPAVWQSTDGVRWALQTLELPAGAESASLSSVASTGTGWLAGGQVQKGSRQVGSVWRSPDGKNWTPSALPAPRGARASVSSLVHTADGDIAVGSVGYDDGPREGQQDAAIWTSRGGAWTLVEMPEGAAGGPGRRSLVSAVVQGADLVGVGSASTRESVRTLVVRASLADLLPVVQEKG